jgi:hypothetical protein
MYGVDYTETFSSVLAAQLDWELHHVDIKSAYLNTTLDEEVYMMPPHGVLKPDKQEKVCKLKKALYGLKQAGREWYNSTWAIHDPLCILPQNCALPHHCSCSY